MNNPSRVLFEVSWEVCNKVGGINTVIRSKAKSAGNAFPDGYITMGPQRVTHPEFSPEDIPQYQSALQRLEKRNIRVRTGRWNIPGTPRCLLVDFRDAFSEHDSLFYRLWEDFGVDSMFGSWDYIEPVLFSTACGIVIEEICRDIPDDTHLFAHFHEWMTGAGLLYLRKNLARINTVFTTHATMLGRALSGTGKDIYAQLETIDPTAEAKKCNVAAKHSLESVSAREADAFTTVSDITAMEARAFLGVKPDLVTPNGFNYEDIPDYSADNTSYETSRKQLLTFASRFLEKDLDPENTRLISISGRYEFHNKGIDILLKSLSTVNSNLKAGESPSRIVALLLVMGGQVGVNEETLIRMKDSLASIKRYAGISTHHVGDSDNDPILKTCRKTGLTNSPEDKCNVILVPVLLDGNDGVINREYYDVISGCDLNVYPSNYEPWGYTPHESLALSVPAVTTDRAGFGKWVSETCEKDTAGFFILRRLEKDDKSATDHLVEILGTVLAWDRKQIIAHKTSARKIAEKAGWDSFYKHYLAAYEKARTSKTIRIEGVRQNAKESQTIFPGANSMQPRFRSFSVISNLPEEIKDLREMAYNMWWVWKSDIRELFARLDPLLWEYVNHNPVALLELVHKDRLEDTIQNDAFMTSYRQMLKTFRRYMDSKSTPIPEVRTCITRKNPIAYFSMEFGIHESVATYSGGLGVLSGDHMKSCSDLNLPTLGISLLYKYGYFNQRINRNGEQIAEFVENNLAQMPIDIVKDSKENRILVNIDLPGRTALAQVWKALVGRTELYFLDTDIDENSQTDRRITSKLYDSGSRERIEQEIVLGIGGARLVAALGIDPCVYHLNEGHSAFLLIERIRSKMEEKKIDFETAREAVKGSTVFTTHTPVEAGNERFDKNLIENYFKNYIQQSGIHWEQFWNLGHVNAGEEGPFDLTLLALKLSNRKNGVSKLHGHVSRKIWHKNWPSFLPQEVPISHITNGVHCLSWMADEIRELLETYAGIGFHNTLIGPKIDWNRVEQIPGEALWRAHTVLKDKLFQYIKAATQECWLREGESPSLIEQFKSKLNPSALTLSFARRFATYKRPLLALSDPERLKAIVHHPDHPVQLVFAGKAHPADKEAQKLIRKLVQLSKSDDFIGSIVFLENYHIGIARLLLSGSDVWLNNPIRPNEASGTSGMKAAINGVINCSILDGWWDEAFNQENGWAIGSRREYPDPAQQNAIDSESLYNLIESHIIPDFYRQNSDRIPEKWVRMMIESIRTVLPVFNTDRMVKDYALDMYEPTVKRKAFLCENNFENAGGLAAWKKKIPSRFSSLHILELRVTGISGDLLDLGEALDVWVKIDKGELLPEEISVEIFIQNLTDTAPEEFIFSPMKCTKEKGGTLVFEGRFTPEIPGQYKYGIRIIPVHPSLCTRYETGLVVWA